MSNLKKNLGYQTIYQVLSTCLPLITSPYLARVLGASQLGVFSYTQSIANYFVLFAALGVINYGTRAIAACKEDKQERSKVFFEVYTFQILTGFISILAYILYIVFICKDNLTIAFLQGLLIIGSIFDINWLFFGIEDFKVTVTRNMFIRISTVIAILLLVKSQDDLWLYTVIMSASLVLSNAILFYFVPKVVDVHVIKKINLHGIQKHIKPNLILFIPLLATSVYHIMDKTMLGILSTYEQTGFYYNADKVINIPIGVINGIGTVMLPRATAMIESGESRAADKLFNFTIEIIVAISAAMAFGIAAISNEFTPFFFGTDYDACILLIIVLSPVLIIKAMSHTSRMQYLIPNHKENIFIQSVFAGAIVNLVLNWFCIPRLGAMGAVIGTLTAELVTCLWQYLSMGKYIQFGKTIMKSTFYLLFGTSMFVIVRCTSLIVTNVFPSIAINIAIEIVIGSTIYAVLCILFWNITKNPIKKVIFSRIKKT